MAVARTVGPRLVQVVGIAPDFYDEDVVHFFFQAEDGIRDGRVTGVQTCALPIYEMLSEHGSPLVYVRTVRARPPQSSLRAARSEERRVGKEGRSRWAR